jgi:hypothetical protein
MDKVLNPVYKNPSTISFLQKEYQDNKDFSSVTLTDVFTPEFFEKKKKEIEELKYLYEIRVEQYSYARSKFRNLQIINNKEVLELVENILQRKIRTIHAQSYKFAWKNYWTLKIKEKPAIDIIIDFSTKWDNSYGGNVVFKKDNGDYVEVPFIPNSITIVRRKGKDKKFVKYVNNHSAGKKRFLIIGTVN